MGKNRHFSKDNIQMTNEHMKRCSTLLANREMQIKTIRRYDFTSVKMAVIKKTGDKKVLARMWRKRNP